MENIMWQSQSHKGVTEVIEWSCHSHSMYQKSQLYEDYGRQDA